MQHFSMKKNKTFESIYETIYMQLSEKQYGLEDAGTMG